MSYSIKVSSCFAKEAKRLAKKYPSFKNDYESFLVGLQENPLQGDELTPGIRKIRIALLLIYDKSDFSTVDVSVVKQIVHDEGYETE